MYKIVEYKPSLLLCEPKSWSEDRFHFFKTLEELAYWVFQFRLQHWNNRLIDKFFYREPFCHELISYRETSLYVAYDECGEVINPDRIKQVYFKTKYISKFGDFPRWHPGSKRRGKRSCRSTYHSDRKRHDISAYHEEENIRVKNVKCHTELDYWWDYPFRQNNNQKNWKKYRKFQWKD